MNQAAQTASAFNLIIEGVGYLNRVRQVTPRKGPTYVACTIRAMMGPADSVEKINIDCRVVGRQAKEAVALLEAVLKADYKARVIVGFRASDPKPDVYEYPHHETKELVKCEGLKARLLQLTFAKVNGEKVEIPLVERAEPTDTDDLADEEQLATAEAA